MPAHLQRFSQAFLQLLPRSADRPRLPALRRYRGGGEGGLSRRQNGPQGPRTVLLVGHGPDVAPVLGALVEGGQRRPTAAALPHLPANAAAGAQPAAAE